MSSTATIDTNEGWTFPDDNNPVPEFPAMTEPDNNWGIPPATPSPPPSAVGHPHTNDHASLHRMACYDDYCYSSHCIVQLPTVCHSERCANHVTKLAIILAASYLQSYSPRPMAIVLADGSVLIAILLIVVVLIASCSSRRAHRVVLIASCSSRRAQQVVLIASCSSRLAQHIVSYLSTFLCFCVKCGSSIYRCTLDRMNRTGLSHYA